MSPSKEGHGSAMTSLITRSDGTRVGPPVPLPVLMPPGVGVFVATQSFVGFAASSSRLTPEGAPLLEKVHVA